MASFQESQWADSAYARDYREGADHYIPDRAALLHTLGSFTRHFVLHPGRIPRVADLGCGDGILTAHLLTLGAPLRVTLIDGSADMLAAARGRFVDQPDLEFIQAGFAELILNPARLGPEPFDLIVSSFAIHHTDPPERRALFQSIHDRLAPGGSFFHIDVGLATDGLQTEWYYALWREWILAHGYRAGIGTRYAAIPDQARANPDNRYSPLEDQLQDLHHAGFTSVACHYRNGLFTACSGTRAIPTPARPGAS